jgi:FkbM family methyltransferase
MAMQWSKGERSEASVQRFNADLDALPVGAVCLDLGANVGEVTELLAKKAGLVHSFEPDPWSFARLKERVGHLPNVVLHQAAVGVADGKITLYRPAGLADNPVLSLGSSTIPANRWLDVEPYEVDAVDLDSFVRSLGVPVALVKMDIEGAEVAILEKLLESPSLGLISSIFVEIHCNIYPQQILPVARLRRQYGKLERPRVDFDWP